VSRAPAKLLLAHGAGGRLTRELVTGTFLSALDNPLLATLTDAAVLPPLPPGRPALTTDGFVVDPPIFPGGDLGYLSVCGTVNDLAMVGARPLWITWSLILEEGADGALIDTCAAGAARACAEAGVAVVAGDTKVVPRGKGDRIFAVTAGLGIVPPERNVGDRCIVPGDVVVASGPLGDHGATIMACRHDMTGAGLRSDCAPVGAAVEALFEAGVEVHSLHDPTRGGTVTVCHEVAERSGHGIVLVETSLPVRPQVRAVCELLGLEPLGQACEGRVLAFIAEQDAERAVAAFDRSGADGGAAVIGRVETREGRRPPVLLETRIGGRRPVDLPSGSELPRIC